MKRPPLVAMRRRDLSARVQALSKQDWIDLYFDLYQQTHGESSPDEEIVADAERRRDILAPLIDDQRAEMTHRRMVSLAMLAARA